MKKIISSTTAQKIFLIAIVLFVAISWLKRLHRNIPAAELTFTIPFSRGAGEQRSLPQEVLAMSVLAGKHPIANFCLSSEISADALLFQRATEFLYPLRVDAASQYMFAFAEEEVSGRCLLVGIEKGVCLYDCSAK